MTYIPAAKLCRQSPNFFTRILVPTHQKFTSGSPKMAKIPPEIITEILSRLPAKSLLRFRCVSKPWCGMIDSPDFIKMHLEQSVKNNSGLSLIVGEMGILYSLDFHKLDQPPLELRVPVGNDSGDAYVIGSCKGLLLLRIEDTALFNPSTRKLHVLPRTPLSYPSHDAIGGVEKCSLVFDSVNDDYKVLKLFRCKDILGRWVGTKAQVYSLKSNSWTKARDFPFYTPCERVWGVHLDGVLHTIGVDEKLLAFDVVTEKSYEIPLPMFSDDSYLGLQVEVLGGCLCVCASYDESRVDMWVMKEYGVTRSWVLLLSIAPPLVNPFETMTPLAYSDDGREVLLNYDEKLLIWYDLEKKTVRRAPFRGLPHPFYVELCVDSLVSPGVKGNTDEKKRKEVKAEKPDEMKKKKKNKKRDGFLSSGFKLVL